MDLHRRLWFADRLHSLMNLVLLSLVYYQNHLAWAGTVHSSKIFSLSLPRGALPQLDPSKLRPGHNNCTSKTCQVMRRVNTDQVHRIASIKHTLMQKFSDPRGSNKMTTPHPAVPEVNTPRTIVLFEDIVTFAEQLDSPNMTANDVVQFKLRGGKPNGQLEARSANLWIMVRMKHRKHRSRSSNVRQRDLRRRRGRRIQLTISNMKEPNSRPSRDAKGGNDHGNFLTEVRLRVTRSHWQKISMPLDLIQNMLDHPEKSLRLRVECQGCGKKVTPVLLYSERRKKQTRSMKISRKSRRRRRRRRLSKKRPLLVIHTRVKSVRPDQGQVLHTGERSRKVII